MSSCDVSPEIARQNAIAGQSTTVVVYAGDKVQEYSVKKQDTDALRCVAGNCPPECNGGGLCRR